jgi:muconolactone delta-isomerase
MKILVLEKPLSHASAKAFEPFLREEAARVWSLCQEGVIREIYFRADRREAVIIMEAADADAARTILSTLPLVRENLVTFDVIPLMPYSGFERLFALSGAS